MDAIRALATHPVTGVMWAVFEQSGQQHLGTIDPATAIATSVGVLPDKFASITFLPEPSSLAALGAGVVALWAMNARRRERRSSRTRVRNRNP